MFQCCGKNLLVQSGKWCVLMKQNGFYVQMILTRKHIQHGSGMNGEVLSLKCAEGDAEWTNKITDFWNNHLPIFLSVKDGYAYYAISMKDGSIVQGTEPEFEECTPVTSSFADF